MRDRSVRAHVEDLRRELGSSRAVLERFALAMTEARGLSFACVGHDGGASRAKLAPALESLVGRDDALGVVYEALHAPALEAAYRATARGAGRKFTPDEIPAVTGLFTPAWVAEFLVRETVGRLTSGQPRTAVGGLRVLDPACGTMNFGLAAADVLRAAYRDEMDRAGRPGWPAEPSVLREAEIGPAILRRNLFGVDLDPTALWLARLSLAMKLRVDPASTPMNLTRADALCGEIPGGFDVVVTNPPYLSARNLPPATVARLKKRFPAAWRDLYACFIERCLRLCRPGGRAGLLTMQSFMFTGAFEGLRERIDAQAALETLVHIGPGLFAGGNPGTLQTAAFTLRREPDPSARARQEVTAVRLTDIADAAAKARALRDGTAPVFRVRQDALAELPRRAWAYWTTPAARRAFTTLPRLRDVAPPRQGLATTDNARFVRYGWEVEPTTPDAPRRATAGRWLAYAKSGRFRRWYESPRHRVNWQHDGREIKAEIVRRYPYLNGAWQWVAKNAGWYGRPGGVTYSYLTSGRFSARRLEPGSVFDVAGSSLFPLHDDADGNRSLALLALLNSAAAAELLDVINPTLNFQVGDLAELPVAGGAGEHAALAGLAGEAINLQRQLDAFDETTTDFRRPIAWRGAAEIAANLRHRLRAVELEVDALAADCYRMPLKRAAAEEDGLPATLGRVDLARRWASYALGRTLGGWGGVRDDDAIVQIRPAPAGLLCRVRAELDEHCGPGAVDEIGRALGGLARFLEADFFAWHAGMYARRPVYWAFGGRQRTLLVAHDAADAATVTRLLGQLGESPPAGWDRYVDDGVQVNLAPLAGAVADASLRTVLKKVNAELVAGRLAWSETAAAISGARGVVSPGSNGGSGRARSAARAGRARRPSPAAART